MGNMLADIGNEGRTPGYKLKLCTYLEQMKPADAADVKAACADLKYTSSQIARALTKRGYPISAAAINTYRQRNTTA